MIFVDGQPISAPNSPSLGSEIMDLLLKNPTLISASEQFKSLPEQKFSIPAQDCGALTRHVYVFQREYATVNPTLVKFVGTDEATTCVGLAISNPSNGMVSVSHMDFTAVVDKGVDQMLQSLANPGAKLDVHLVGGFDDSPTTEDPYRRQTKKEGYSLPLCSKIIESLLNRSEEFHIQTMCVLGHNTETDFQGHARPIIGGFLVDTLLGEITPACFENSARCPDEIVRRIRITVSSDDPRWEGKLLDTYDTSSDMYRITPVSWNLAWGKYARLLQKLSDKEILSEHSTSPFAEPPQFVQSQRRIWRYLAEHPDWRWTFPTRKPRIFQRTNEGNWSQMCKIL